MTYKGYQFSIMLDSYLKEKNIKRGTFAKRVQSSFQIIDKYCKNNIERYDSYLLLKICIELNCEIGDILNIENIKEDETK